MPGQFPDWRCIEITGDGSKDTGVCPCCGGVSRFVWGYAMLGDTGLARYSVHWTIGAVATHGANVDLVLGPWDDGTPNHDRRAVSLAYRLFEGGPSFMVIDARGRRFRRLPALGQPMSREQVVGSWLAALSFAVVDAIWMKDARTRELVPG